MAVPKKVKLEKDTSHDTEPESTVSGEQHANLGKRKMSSSKPSPGDTEPEHLAVVQVPTSPEPDSALPNLSDEQPVTGNFRELPDWQTPSFTSERPKRFKPGFEEVPYKPGAEIPSLHKPTIPTNTIMLLGFTLILANLFVGGNLTSLGTKVLNKPEGVGPTKTKEGQALLMQFLGEVAFVLVLVTLSRIFPNMTRPIVIFLLGVWLVWIIFILPDAIKNFQNQGLLAMLGITGSKDTTASGTPQKSAPGHRKTGPPKGGSYYEQGYRGNYSIGV